MKDEAEAMGFLGVLSGPLVRSSYRAGRLWALSMQKKGLEIAPELQHLGRRRSKIWISVRRFTSRQAFGQALG